MAFTTIPVPTDIETNTLFDSWVPIAKTMIAPYGRPLSETKVSNLVNNWNPKAIGVILLSWRHDEERYAILDGQHRTEAAHRKGMETIPARIYIDLTYQEEADLYVRFATVNKQTSIDRYRARLEAGDPVILDIQSLLTEFGLELPAQATGTLNSHQISCTFTLEKVYVQHGRTVLHDTLQTLHAAWKGRHGGYGQQTIDGTAAFWARYQGKASPTHAVDVLQRTTPEEVAILARKTEEVMGQMRSSYAWGRAILRLYNNRLKNPLPDWQDRLIRAPHADLSAKSKRGWATRRAASPQQEEE